jgi:hypothetical protein
MMPSSLWPLHQVLEWTMDRQSWANSNENWHSLFSSSMKRVIMTLNPRSKWLQKHCANEIPCCTTWREWLWHWIQEANGYKSIVPMRSHVAQDSGNIGSHFVLCRRSMKLRSKGIWLITCHLIINKSVKILIALGLWTSWPVGPCRLLEKLDCSYRGK